MEILIFIFPFLNFVISLFPFSYKYTNVISVINCVLMLFSFFLSIYLFVKLFQLNTDAPIYFYPLFYFNQGFIDWSLRLDLYVSVLISIVTFFSSIYLICSINYYKDSLLNLKLIRNLSLLNFGTLIMISSNNLIQFFIAWQLIVLSYFLLIKSTNINYNLAANSKIFLYNRFSDLSFFLGIYFIYTLNNSFNFNVFINNNNFVDTNIFILGININKAELAVFFLWISFLFRHRQFFISNSIYDIRDMNITTLTSIICSTFLPLIIFFTYRFFPLINSTPNFLTLMIVLSFCLTLIFLYLSLNETNIKLLITYLASSQACIIFYAFSLKKFSAAMFHFMTSSLSIMMLYLCLGFVITKLNNVSNVKEMGGLIFKIPSIFLFTLIPFFSISGIPFFSGYYSKDALVSALYFSDQNFSILSLILAFSISFLIPYILFKTIALIFLGSNKGNIHLFNKINENSYFIIYILFCLGIGVVFSGWLMKNLFDGSNTHYFWSFLISYDVSFSIQPDVSSIDWLKNLLIYSSILAILLAFLNYVIMPFILNNYKLKYYKLFTLYNKYFLRL